MTPGWIEPIRHGRDSRTYLGHTFRYYLAKGFLKPTDVVVDVGCGCGYGSVILASACKRVLGLDNDKEALALAKTTYHVKGKTSFQLTDLEETEEFPDCDVAVCFETLEHLSNPEHMAALMREKAKRLIIISTPWKDTGSPWHKHKFFTEQQIRDMFEIEPWKCWEFVRQGPYQIWVFYRCG